MPDGTPLPHLHVASDRLCTYCARRTSCGASASPLSGRSRVIDGRKVLPIKARTAPGFGERVLASRVPTCGSGRFLVETLGQQLNRFPKEYSRFGFRRSCSQARLRAHESEYFGGTLVYMLG